MPENTPLMRDIQKFSAALDALNAYQDNKKYIPTEDEMILIYTSGTLLLINYVSMFETFNLLHARYKTNGGKIPASLNKIGLKPFKGGITD